MALGLALLGSSPAAADPFNRPGAFVGLGMNYGVPGFQDTGGVSFGDSLGFNVRGGYRFNEFVAVEGIYEYMDDFGTGRQRVAGSTVTEDTKTNAFSINGKLLLPLGRFQPYLSGGIGFLNADAELKLDGRHFNGSGTSFAGRFAGGVDVWATDHISLYAESAYTMGTDTLSDLYYFNVGWGARYNF
jgi:opacity protein-like surface antigen